MITLLIILLLQIYMNTYEVLYMDNVSFQDNFIIEADSKYEAAVQQIQNDDLSLNEMKELRVRVYPTGKPKNDEIFVATDLI